MSKDISTSGDALRAYIEEAVKIGKFPDEGSAYARALELLRHNEPSTAPSGRRQGGQWKGQVATTPDFNDLPDDLADSLGIK